MNKLTKLIRETRFWGSVSVAIPVLIFLKYWTMQTIVRASVERTDTAATTVVDCRYEVSCTYPDEVDLRLIVLSYNRAASLEKLLLSLGQLELNGDRASLAIWIDRSKDGEVDNATLGDGTTVSVASIRSDESDDETSSCAQEARWNYRSVVQHLKTHRRRSSMQR